MHELKQRTVVNIVSFVQKSNGLEWMAVALENEPIHSVFILLNPGNTPLEDFLRNKGITVYRVSYSGKNSIPRSIVQVACILRREGATVVHCHLFDACIVGLIAARVVGIRHRLYTRHNSTIHHLYFPRAVYYDRFINWMSTGIVSISPRVSRVLTEMEQVPAEKIHLVPHGFDFSSFKQISEDRIAALRRRYGLENVDHPVIGVISRYIHWKGIQYIIPAFAKLRRTHPTAVLVLANASGPYKEQIRVLLAGLPASSYREIAFESDVQGLFCTFDAFVHTPVDDHSEAFGQVYIEAMASGIPGVITLSGIAHEYAEDGKNCLVVEYQNSEQITAALNRLFADPKLYQIIVSEGRRTALRYDMVSMISGLRSLYRIPS